MNIKQLIKEAHENAVSKGFYECPECIGNGFDISDYDFTKDGWGGSPKDCDNCNGTGKDPNKNIGELLMLIVSELGEALEAHRKGRFCDWGEYKKNIDYHPEYCESKKQESVIFENHIKDTFEDEIADVFIRLFDLCGYLGIKAFGDFEIEKQKELNIPEVFLFISGTLYNIYVEDQINTKTISIIYNTLLFLCNDLNIDIEKHIKAKMEYNKTRDYKHGKNY